MGSQENIPLFPVTEILVGPLKPFGAVTVRFAFVTNAMQPVTEANPGRHYILSKVQAESLIEQIQRSLQMLGTGEPPAPPGPWH